MFAVSVFSRPFSLSLSKGAAAVPAPHLRHSRESGNPGTRVPRPMLAVSAFSRPFGLSLSKGAAAVHPSTQLRTNGYFPFVIPAKAGIQEGGAVETTGEALRHSEDVVRGI